VEVLKGLFEQRDLLGFMLAFLPTTDALRGLGLASHAWHDAVTGALPHVTIKGQLPAGASLADRFPSLTSLHIDRLSADDLPALLAGGLSHRLVRLSVVWDKALCDAFPEVFFASEWPQLEQLGLTKSLPRVLDQAQAHPAALARLQSLGFISGYDPRAVASAVKAGLLPSLRTVENDAMRSGDLHPWRTILKHARDTPVLRLDLRYWCPRAMTESDDSGLDSDAGQAGARLGPSLFAGGATSRLR
jgi:hypothetical protein